MESGRICRKTVIREVAEKKVRGDWGVDLILDVRDLQPNVEKQVQTFHGFVGPL